VRVMREFTRFRNSENNECAPWAFCSESSCGAAVYWWVCRSRRKKVKVKLPSIILHKISGYTKNSIQRGACPIIRRLAVATTQTATRLKSSTLTENIYAKRREDGKYILIPREKVERNRDNPDGRNHLCAPPPNPLLPSDTVYCFALGGAT
jgi:hypothetical protein